jgi:WhiB family redox-sensing transcriptional regulator
MNLTESELSDLRDELLTAGECLADPELHRGPDPQTGTESAEERAAREDVAREVCGFCPVAATCLTYAVRTRPERGIWAGFTAEQVGALAELLATQPANGRVVFTIDEAMYLFTASDQIGAAVAAKAAQLITIQQDSAAA